MDHQIHEEERCQRFAHRLPPGHGERPFQRAGGAEDGVGGAGGDGEGGREIAATEVGIVGSFAGGLGRGAEEAGGVIEDGARVPLGAGRRRGQLVRAYAVDDPLGDRDRSGEERQHIGGRLHRVLRVGATALAPCATDGRKRNI